MNEESAIRVRLDPTNPGQFFACCGLLELADRFWSGAEASFEERAPFFLLRPTAAVPALVPGALIHELAHCVLTNTMTDAQLQRRDDLSSIPKKHRQKDASLEAEKKALDALWRESPLLLHEPFNLRLDWFVDQRAGGGILKTWAGQQAVVDIARGMKAGVANGSWTSNSPEDWFSRPLDCNSVPFNFDSDVGGMGSDRDIGFSLDPLKNIKVRTRPLVEFLALVGLQRFRPARVGMANRFRFSWWFEPLAPEVAAVAACGVLESSPARAFEFRLLYRTKYLKSFLPANTCGGAK